MLSDTQARAVGAHAHVRAQVIPTLPHENDGLVFTPVNSPYTCGADPKLLKWKVREERVCAWGGVGGARGSPARRLPQPLSLNTVDFSVKVHWIPGSNGQYNLILQIGNKG